MEIPVQETRWFPMNSLVPQVGYYVVWQPQTASCGLPVQHVDRASQVDDCMASVGCYDVQHAGLRQRTLTCDKEQSQGVVLSLSECLADNSEQSAVRSSANETCFTAEPPSQRQRRRGKAQAKSEAKQKGDKNGYSDIDTVPSPFPWPSQATTVMVRNIPNRYTVEEFLADMLSAGSEGTFDFLYIPMDFNTKRNRGYGFVNFLSVDAADTFARTFHGAKLQRYTTTKVVAVSPAVTQGLEANLSQYTRKDAQRIKNQWFRPLVFKDGIMA